jgi:hypothetical protein
MQIRTKTSELGHYPKRKRELSAKRRTVSRILAFLRSAVWTPGQKQARRATDGKTSARKC